MTTTIDGALPSPPPSPSPAMEKRLATAEGTARDALQTLATVVPPGWRPGLAAAGAALDRFLAVNAELVVLSLAKRGFGGTR